MLKTDVWSHKSGEKVVPNDLKQQVKNAVETIAIPVGKGKAPEIRKQIIKGLHNVGWSDPIKLDASSNISITSVNNKIGACVQLGNVSRTYADLIKLQTLFLRGSIVAGIIILPSKEAAKALGQNMANSARLKKEIEIFSAVMTLPLLVFGFGD